MRPSPIKLGNLIMRTLAVIVSIACLAAPAFAQPSSCTSPHGVRAEREFVEGFQAANAALTARNFASALAYTAAARPHAINRQQSVALDSLEIMALTESDPPAARQRMQAALSDACLPPQIRQKYVDKLAG